MLSQPSPRLASTMELVWVAWEKVSSACLGPEKKLAWALFGYGIGMSYPGQAQES